MNKKNIAYYIIERLYPYCISIIAVICCRCLKVNMMIDKGFSDMLDGLVTLDSIIIGFMGAIMPVVLSMKNESKFVRYVFEKDTDNLFCKYLKITLLLGICNVLITLVMHVKSTIPKEWRMNFYYMWIFMTVTFLLATYRSMSHMIMLIFAKDEDSSIPSVNELNKQSAALETARSSELREKYKRKD